MWIWYDFTPVSLDKTHGTGVRWHNPARLLLLASAILNHHTHTTFLSTDAISSEQHKQHDWQASQIEDAFAASTCMHTQHLDA
mmetsp:Transcript_3860/g.10484  ORF Transcript_3860/g.10484 Transcript_3860/m.10484 type:complete len:83 (-) Transcript_3860:650-898(-)